MEEANLSQLNEAEMMNIYSNVIESGSQILIAKSVCKGSTPYDCGNACCNKSSCDMRTATCIMK